jgi:uncharacterized protein YjiS (DUF1127 family)
MSSLKTIPEKLAAWRRYRGTVRELSQLTDRDLSDIGIWRGDIETVARQSAMKPLNGGRAAALLGLVAKSSEPKDINDFAANGADRQNCKWN